jgi:uncharacterized membrane protein
MSPILRLLRLFAANPSFIAFAARLRWRFRLFANNISFFIVELEVMPTKYDTNPLDPNFPEKVKADAEAEMATQMLDGSRVETRKFANVTEEQTRRFAAPNGSAYSAPPYTGQYVPTNYQTSAFTGTDRSISRKVDKVGLPENILVAAAYFPFSLGLVASLLELLLVPKHESKVRFHAAQGLAAHIGYLVISAIFGVIEGITGSNTGSGIFQVAAAVMFIIFVVKAWKGKPIHIQPLDDLTNWLDEKIGPIKS